MTASERSKAPDFFEDHGFDPVSTATRYPPAEKSVPKKKVGFYLPEALIDRFNRQYHQMKLAGAPIDNKSTLVEMALQFALDDIEKGTQSLILKTLQEKK